MTEQHWRNLISEEVASWLASPGQIEAFQDSDLVEFIRTGVWDRDE